MPRLLTTRNPGNFKNLPLLVTATADTLTYEGVGMPINFAQMIERRCPLELDDTQAFSVQLANLGVSVRLTLRWQNRDYWVLVRQRREDRGDVVLKLISGYVPAHEFNLPLHTAVQEVAEECLLETPEGWLNGRFKDTWLPAPYEGMLRYRESPAFALSPRTGAAKPVRCASLNLIERPQAYVHLPTSSLQLVYDLCLEIPRDVKSLSLFHVDERLEKGQLETRLNRRRPDLYLLPLLDGKPVPKLYTLRRDKLLPANTRGVFLAESFAAQDGWVVREERIRWADWMTQQGLVEPKHQRTGLTRLRVKARRLVRMVRGRLPK
jgi:hypothetical protein